MAAVMVEDQYKLALTNIHALVTRMRRVVSAGVTPQVEAAVYTGIQTIQQLCEASGAVPPIAPDAPAGRALCLHTTVALDFQRQVQVCALCRWQRSLRDAAHERDRWFPPVEAED